MDFSKLSKLYEAAEKRGEGEKFQKEINKDFDEAEKRAKQANRSGSGGARGGGGGGGGMKPDTDITASKKLPKMAKGGSVSASKRADGIAQRGKTRGKYI